MTRNVAVLIFDEVEVLDFAGPFEVFGVTRVKNGTDQEAPFNVYTVAENDRPITARNGLSVNPHYTIHNGPLPNLIIVPGGYGTRREMNNPAMIEWVRAMDAQTERTLSVCTGAFLLAKAGLLTGKPATTHYKSYDTLASLAPGIEVRPGARFVEAGKVITSAGISAGIDMSLHVVSLLLGAEVAAETAAYMEYEYWRG